MNDPSELVYAYRYPFLWLRPKKQLTDGVEVRIDLAVEVWQVGPDGVARHKAYHSSQNEQHHQLISEDDKDTASTKIQKPVHACAVRMGDDEMTWDISDWLRPSLELIIPCSYLIVTTLLHDSLYYIFKRCIKLSLTRITSRQLKLP